MWNGDWDERNAVFVQIERLQLSLSFVWQKERDFVASLSKFVGDVEERGYMAHGKPWVHDYVKGFVTHICCKIKIQVRELRIEIFLGTKCKMKEKLRNSVLNIRSFYISRSMSTLLTMTFLPEGGVAATAEEGSRTSNLGGFMASPP
jgi:hypothetical protein